MSSVNNRNSNLTVREEQSFWKKNVAGIPVWFIILVLLLLLLLWAYREGRLGWLGLAESPATTLQFRDQRTLLPISATPVEGRVQALGLE